MADDTAKGPPKTPTEPIDWSAAPDMRGMDAWLPGSDRTIAALEAALAEHGRSRKAARGR